MTRFVTSRRLDPLLVAFGPTGREAGDQPFRLELRACREVRLALPDRLGTSADLPRHFLAQHSAGIDLLPEERAEDLEREGSVRRRVMSELGRVGVGHGWVSFGWDHAAGSETLQ